MDDAPSLFRRLRPALLYLGAGVLLAESSRVLLAWLQSLPGRKAGAEQAKHTGHASVAFLIDGENISSRQVEGVIELALNEAKKLGEVTVRRVFGNCELFNQANNVWNDTSLRLELEQIHLARPTVNKNTADIALTINAIELAKDGVCNRFCLVTSDSDFTPLVRRLRQLKCQVLGVGDKRTPATLMKACNWFVYTDRLSETTPAAPRTAPRSSRSQTTAAPAHEASRESQPASPPPEQQPGSQPPGNSSQTVIDVLTAAYLEAAHVRGDWVLLSRLGLTLRRLYPDFKATDYGGDLSAFIRQHPDVFDIEKRPNGHPQMRLKQ